MMEWCSKVNYLIGTQNLTQSDISDAVASSCDFHIREGVVETFGILLEKGIPIIILSAAGVGNVIDEVVRQCIAKPDGTKGSPWPNVRVLSNTMIFDADGNFSEFSEPLVHMYNKSLQDAPDDIRQILAGRDVGVLCGDSLGDLTMAHGHTTTDLLKFGFLNENVDERMGKYIGTRGREAFDRIILNDGDWSPILDLFKRL